MEKEDLYQAVISLILGMAMAYYWDADWQKHSSIAQAYEQLRDYCCSVNPFSAYKSRGVMCQKVKFWCTLLSFWIVLISISDKRISGLPESLFFKILRLRDIPKA